MRVGGVLLNFGREGVVDNNAIAEALSGDKLGAYIRDFPSAELPRHPRVVTLPHLGAGKREAGRTAP